ncbi:uncharacterized protein LY89DRAFT_690846 [Mollisia scopiformis]|uniref:Uncharacterized protein n=1 Tax=Mollisia scopiformis TaxID=149040 RepID=A0A132BB38_MOLSC|nr:uncharacterized protein LY89DRAFT_690846 [Mollisia scopiformis]KUJ08877.1 hypothetical protein LY89DRAFT_690846 [Mollisia scopiformis]
MVVLSTFPPSRSLVPLPISHPRHHPVAESTRTVLDRHQGPRHVWKSRFVGWLSMVMVMVMVMVSPFCYSRFRRDVNPIRVLFTVRPHRRCVVTLLFWNSF